MKKGRILQGVLRTLIVVTFIAFAFLGTVEDNYDDPAINAMVEISDEQLYYGDDPQVYNGYGGIEGGSGAGVTDPTAPITPETFETPEGYKGWKVKIPQGLPLATPAYGDGRIFIGGGYGSYSFYSLDAKSGELDWHFACGDDGPTAAVVYGDRVAFNTESCILDVLDPKSGEVVWEEYLGDPLMSQPAIADGRIYIAYPGGSGGTSHTLTCRDLETGEQVFDAPINGDCITAPIINNKSLFVATLGGTVYHMSANTGVVEWEDQKNATSAPWIDEYGELYVALREEVTVGDTTEQHEGLGVLTADKGTRVNEDLYAKDRAEYLNYDTESEYYKKQMELDASVGFGTAPAAAGLGQAEANLGIGSVSGAWAYQGSRPTVYDGISYNAQGNNIRAIDNETGKVLWETVYDEENDIGGRPLTPPALVGDYLFFGSVTGDILCVEVETGKTKWKYNVGEPIRFQPCIAKGRVYVGTDYGSIYCIDTGDRDLDGWYMWGGNAAHNGYED